MDNVLLFCKGDYIKHMLRSTSSASFHSYKFFKFWTQKGYKNLDKPEQEVGGRGLYTSNKSTKI